MLRLFVCSISFSLRFCFFGTWGNCQVLDSGLFKCYIFIFFNVFAQRYGLPTECAAVAAHAGLWGKNAYGSIRGAAVFFFLKEFRLYILNSIFVFVVVAVAAQFII